MASGNSLLSEDQLLCPICLDVFNRPVSTPCGHNFCLSCLTAYWDDIPVSQCPVCKESFERRPDLKVNTFISQLASQFMSLQLTDAHTRSPDGRPPRRGGAVPCDICTDSQREAVRSCLECLTSYCDVHLEPHHRAAGLKRHTLVEPTASLEDRICKEHSRLLTVFCKNDEVLLCDVCAGSRHANHDVVYAQHLYKERRALLEDTEAQVQQMIQERTQKVQDVTAAVERSKTDTKEGIAHSVRDLATLVSEIQKSQTELAEAMEEKQRAAEERAAGLISGVEREIGELRETATKLRELKRTEDPLTFLHCSSDPSLLPRMTDLSTVSFNGQVEMRRIQEVLSNSVSQLRKSLKKLSTDIQNVSDGSDVSDSSTLSQVQQYEVDVVLDAETAHPLLVLSDDRKQVRYMPSSGIKRSPNPNMFTTRLAVLGQRGFSTRRFYFEVFVGGKTEWILGVAAASIPRRGALRISHSGLWAIQFVKGTFKTVTSANSPVLFGKVERVGVFVDYDGGKICFYDVQNSTLMYSFTECGFTETLHPYFNPCDDEHASNLGPMIIVPVHRKVNGSFRRNQ
ncbi:E3 ubiquitin-protein ligase TRIM39 [Liparis tanakae]|uniref:E3 ubiquitin-protein ligase TRIM39 n=1 Tax=Liparis tanakae TaxID=230148 RepID=A0A4Z2HU18_9TELE|nr:E3 ubiquitin-protein ligase TRIM39 [Liparis tanakae]